MERHAIERLTAAELQAMDLQRLGESLADAFELLSALSFALESGESKLAELRCAENIDKTVSEKNAVIMQRAVVGNLKTRVRCVRDMRSSLQTMIRSVGVI